MNRQDAESWFKNLPPVTKVFILSSFITTLLITIELISPQQILFNRFLITKNLQLWRLVTNYFFAGKFSYPWLIHMYLWSQFSTKLEKNQVFTSSSPGAFLWFILIQMLCLNLLGVITYWPQGKPVLSSSLLFAVIFYWSRREPWEPVSVYFITVQGYQLPFALLFIQLILGAPIWDGLIGLISGQIYYYFHDVLPFEVRGWSLIPKCPIFLDNLVSHYGSQPTQHHTTTTHQTQAYSSWFSSSPENPVRRRTQTNEFPGTGHRLGSHG